MERKPEFFHWKGIKIGIIGCGYVGLPLALRFADVGQRVTGFDLDKSKIDKLNAGQSYIQHIPADKIASHVEAKTFRCHDGFHPPARYGRCSDLRPHAARRTPRARPELRRANRAAPSRRICSAISSSFSKAPPIPGTTEELVLPILEKGGLRCPIAHGDGTENIATDFYLAFSPEREDPGNKQFGLAQIPKVVGGINPASGRAAAGMYAQIVSKVVPVSSTRAAEMVKLLENIFRCVNIALVNELKQLCLRMDLDIWEIIDSAATKPFGFMPFYPGPGPRRTLHSRRSLLSFLEGARIRFRHALHRAGRRNQYRDALSRGECRGRRAQRSQKSIKGSKILLLGVAYKKDVDDLRESPSLKLLELLTARGAVLDYNDPYFAALLQDAPLRFFEHALGRPLARTPRELRLRPDRHRSLQLRL